MIVDTSALSALLDQEPGWEKIEQVLFRSNCNRISAGNYVELAIVVANRMGEAGASRSDDLLRYFGVKIEPFDERQAILARYPFYTYGKGRHSAALNFGDCFAYALSRSSGEPLLYVGQDFLKTDVIPALIL